MKLLLRSAPLLLVAGVATAFAGDGRVMFSVPANERVKIVELSSEDAFFSDRGKIVGITCTTDGPSNYNGDGWHGGAVKDCTNGSTYYFYKAAYVDQGPASASGPAALAGTRARRQVASGNKVKILDLSPEDAYYNDRGAILGKVCRLDGASTFKDAQWHGGQVYCDDGSSYYFYKAAYEDLGAAAVAAPTIPSGAVNYVVPAGSRVSILALNPEDAFYSDRASIVGKACTLSTASSLSDAYWHAGQVACDDGSSYYFYKAAYGVLASAPAVSRPPGALTYSLPKGTRIVIAEIAPDDAYFSTKAGMIGKRCSMGEQSILRDGYWHGGQVNCDDGTGYYFYKAAFQLGG